MNLFNVTEADRAFYEERLRDFPPSRVVDIHTHCWLNAFRKEPGDATSLLGVVASDLRRRVA